MVSFHVFLKACLCHVSVLQYYNRSLTAYRKSLCPLKSLKQACIIGALEFSLDLHVYQGKLIIIRVHNLLREITSHLQNYWIECHLCPKKCKLRLRINQDKLSWVKGQMRIIMQSS